MEYRDTITNHIITPIEKYVETLESKWHKKKLVHFSLSERYFEAWLGNYGDESTTGVSIAAMVYHRDLFKNEIDITLLPSSFGALVIQRIGVSKYKRRLGYASFIINEVMRIARESKFFFMVCISSVMSDDMHNLIKSRYDGVYTMLPYNDDTYYFFILE